MSDNTTNSGYIVIPKKILTDVQLGKPNIREFYGVILSLSCQNGFCFASNKYFADYLNCDIHSVTRWITKLKQLGYIKTEYIKSDGKNNIEQRKIYPQKVLTDLSIPTNSNAERVLTDLSSTYQLNGVEGTNSNAEDNNKELINNLILNNNSMTKRTPAKEKYAEFVSMTNAEYQALIDSYGEADTKSMIEILDNYKGSCGKKYKSDYRAIKNWVVGELDKRKKNNNTGGNNGAYKQDDYAAIGW